MKNMHLTLENKWEKSSEWSMQCGEYSITKSLVRGEPRYQIYLLPNILLAGTYPTFEAARIACFPHAADDSKA